MVVGELNRDIAFLVDGEGGRGHVSYFQGESEGDCLGLLRDKGFEEDVADVVQTASNILERFDFSIAPLRLVPIAGEIAQRITTRFAEGSQR